jgi:hypothetical protein
VRDPRFAPKRTDLPFLRHRAQPRSTAAVADFFHNEPHAHPPHAPSPPSSSLDLGAPATPPPAAPRASTSLDLGATPSTPAPAPVAAPGRARPASVGPGQRLAAVARVRAGEQRLLRVKDPTVTLTRVQSGVGTLTVEAVTSDRNLRIGCAYQLTSGVTSTVQLAGGSRVAPPGSRRPVVLAQREDYEQLTFDLRQIDELQRAVVYAFSEDGTPLTWTGTLVATTFGGGRIELPLDTLYEGAVAVPMSLVNVGGELWVRAEMETIAGPIRDACRAYGFDRITWKDERTPAD